MTSDSPRTARVSPPDPVALQADRWMRDTRFDALRPQLRRRALVLAAAGTIFTVAAACLADRSILVVLALAPAWGAWWVLQRVVRGMADLPEAYVDERMRSVRDRYYRLAYLTLAGLVLPVLVGLYIAADARLVQWRPEARHLHALFWVVQLTAMMLPSMLVAWNEPEV